MGRVGMASTPVNFVSAFLAGRDLRGLLPVPHAHPARCPGRRRGSARARRCGRPGGRARVGRLLLRPFEFPYESSLNQRKKNRRHLVTLLLPRPAIEGEGRDVAACKSHKLQPPLAAVQTSAR